MLAEDANDFDQRLKALIYDADQATYYIGFLKSVVANADVVHDRLNDSYCGFAGVTAYKGAKEGLILYCNRAWEDMSDAISLPICPVMLLSLKSFLNQRSSVHSCLNVTTLSPCQ